MIDKKLLIKAAKEGNLSIFDAIMSHDTQYLLNIKDENNNNLIMIAVENNSLSLTYKLLQYNFDLSTQNKKGNTALMIAVEQDTLSIGAAIIKSMKKQDINIQNNDGDTALTLAAKKENLSLCNIILSYSYKDLVPIKNKQNYNALMIAVENDSLSMTHSIVRKSNEQINAQNNKGDTALTIAARKDNYSIINVLVQNKANPYIENNTKTSAFNYSFKHDSISALRRYREGVEKGYYAIPRMKDEYLYSDEESTQNNTDTDIKEQHHINTQYFYESIKNFINKIRHIIFKKNNTQTNEQTLNVQQFINNVDVTALYALINNPLQFKNNDLAIKNQYQILITHMSSLLEKIKNNETNNNADIIETFIELKESVINNINLHKKIDELSEKIDNTKIQPHLLELKQIYSTSINKINELETTVDNLLLGSISKDIRVHKHMYKQN